ncbi:MAG: hypothetical protein DWH74_00365 [Planctomycetota bacterium]|nr:MAG: hypothetical protein DWH74_00365 [Planctomycetota bacterium]
MRFIKHQILLVLHRLQTPERRRGEEVWQNKKVSQTLQKLFRPVQISQMKRFLKLLPPKINLEEPRCQLAIRKKRPQHELVAFANLLR